MMGRFYVWQEPRHNKINSEAYTISEVPCAIGDTRVWSNSIQVMGSIRRVMDKHREGRGDGPLTQKVIVSGMQEGIAREISGRESEGIQGWAREL